VWRTGVGGFIALFASQRRVRSASGPSSLRNEGGLARGKTYSGVRGEILRPPGDELQRRHFPRIPSSIKNQSVGIEDD
jgi:hypothetical protein